MRSFNFYNPVQIYFGENAIENLSEELKKYGKNILLTYGGGSIKKSGIYDKVIKYLQDGEKNIYELAGIMPNPRTVKVYEGIKICKEHNIDFILAVGGGSVIDCSKYIAGGAKFNDDFWDKLIIRHEAISDALPLGVILTVAATGSEMNSGAVITNWEEKLKLAYGSKFLFPKFSILDPTYTYTMLKDQMVYGCVDMISHIFEIYFSHPDESNVSDDICEALMKNIIENLEVALINPLDYNARSNLMWDSTMALNGITRLGKEQDWMSHQIEHALSAFFDIPHGAGLAIVHPIYLKYIYKNALKKFVRYAKNIWNVDPTSKTDDMIALEGIEKTRAYFKRIGAPITLTEVGIKESAIEGIVEKIRLYKTSYSLLTKLDLNIILHNCL